MAFRRDLNKIMNILHSPVPTWNCHLPSKACLRQTLNPIAGTKSMHVRRQSTLKDITFGFGNRQNAVTLCEGNLKPHFKPQPYRIPGLRGQQLLVSAWLRAQRCTVPGGAAILGSALLRHCPWCAANPCSWTLLMVEARKPQSRWVNPVFAGNSKNRAEFCCQGDIPCIRNTL